MQFMSAAVGVYLLTTTCPSKATTAGVPIITVAAVVAAAAATMEIEFLIRRCCITVLHLERTAVLYRSTNVLFRYHTAAD